MVQAHPEFQRYSGGRELPSHSPEVYSPIGQSLEV